MSGFAYGVYLVVTVQITIYEFLKYLIWNTVNNFRNSVFCVWLDFVLQRGHNYIICMYVSISIVQRKETKQ